MGLPVPNARRQYAIGINEELSFESTSRAGFRFPDQIRGGQSIYRRVSGEAGELLQQPNQVPSAFRPESAEKNFAQSPLAASLKFGVVPRMHPFSSPVGALILIRK